MAHKKKGDLPKVPWDSEVEVVYAGDMFYSLRLGTVEAEVHWDGTWWCNHDSREEISDHMRIDGPMTVQIQADFEKTYDGGGWADWREKWVRGATIVPQGRLGPKDWVPKGRNIHRKFGKVFGPDRGGYGSENTYNLDSTYWWGDTFEYTHFITADDEEGAILQWHNGGDARGNYGAPEIWMGGFGSFMQSQDEGEPESPETFLHWNNRFDNTLLWAFDELGLFEGTVHMMTKFGGEQEPVSHEPPKQIVDAIDENHGILYPSLVEKILAHPDVLSKKLVLVAGQVMDRWRREMEEGQGQKYLWEPEE